ncbi:MAG: hypothetical protein AVDCRST_MAG19-3673 [uncultured Thermomicrobiales bacterium]|uniref:Uncharacterized protein n=1 Tax=uncultured Thermomicrobiales bacterium TaxID=1645740 RepID=A0A6J4VIM5_9BACT|nr:MAG: hypothetical protein AVDCRST_MAG19-3673 [uncultured Thermomicrobiales bacterium]
MSIAMVAIGASAMVPAPAADGVAPMPAAPVRRPVRLLCRHPSRRQLAFAARHRSEPRRLQRWRVPQHGALDRPLDVVRPEPGTGAENVHSARRLPRPNEVSLGSLRPQAPRDQGPAPRPDRPAAPRRSRTASVTTAAIPSGRTFRPREAGR